MMDLSLVNIWAVLLATAVTMVLGFLWYSPVLFGNAWMKRIEKSRDELSGGPMTYILTALTALLGSIVLSLLLTMVNEPSISSGLLVGLLIGIAVSVKIGMNYLFEGRTWGLYLITIGYHIVTFLLIGFIIGAMQG